MPVAVATYRLLCENKQTKKYLIGYGKDSISHHTVSLNVSIGIKGSVRPEFVAYLCGRACSTLCTIMVTIYEPNRAQFLGGQCDI